MSAQVLASLPLDMRNFIAVHSLEIAVDKEGPPSIRIGVGVRNMDRFSHFFSTTAAARLYYRDHLGKREPRYVWTLNVESLIEAYQYAQDHDGVWL